MSVAKNDQERASYAWMYGAQARKDGNAQCQISDRSLPMRGWTA